MQLNMNTLKFWSQTGHTFIHTTKLKLSNCSLCFQQDTNNLWLVFSFWSWMVISSVMICTILSLSTSLLFDLSNSYLTARCQFIKGFTGTLSFRQISANSAHICQNRGKFTEQKILQSPANLRRTLLNILQTLSDVREVRAISPPVCSELVFKIIIVCQ